MAVEAIIRLAQILAAAAAEQVVTAELAELADSKTVALLARRLELLAAAAAVIKILDRQVQATCQLVKAAAALEFMVKALMEPLIPVAVEAGTAVRAEITELAPVACTAVEVGG